MSVIEAFGVVDDKFWPRPQLLVNPPDVFAETGSAVPFMACQQGLGILHVGRSNLMDATSSSHGYGIKGLFLRIRRQLAQIAGLLGLFGLITCFVSCDMRQKEETRWTMINVAPGQNQADCHLIEFPNGAKALVDIADASDAPGTALAFLKKHKIKHVELVVISHFHRDHYGRLVDLIKAGVKIDRVAINLPASREQMDREHQGTPLADWDDVQATLQFLRERQIPYFMPKEGERLIDASTNGIPVYLDVVCLYDGIHTPVGPTDINDTSIILRLSHGPTRALFTGDLNTPMGMWLAQSNLDLKADILKVPHHGTEGCAPDEFFLRVNPKAALVPAPKALWLSLRSKRIRDFFSTHHIPAYVSGIHGNVKVTMTAQGFAILAQHPDP